MERKVLALYAEKKPMAGVAYPGPHQTYRHPRLVVEHRSLPALSSKDIRVEMIYAGVCGTDLHLVQQDSTTGYIKTSSPTLIPEEGRILGHEGIGRVIAVGPEVRHVDLGAIVALESIVVCGQCDRCHRGLPNQCRHSKLIGMEADGVFASVADLPASLAHDVSSFILNESDLQALACLEPAGVAWVACSNAELTEGERIVIFGAGPIGLYCAMLARIFFKAAFIEIVEPGSFRRKFAATWADRVSAPEEFFATTADEIDVAIEASGTASNVDRVLQQMNARGRIVVLGRSGEPIMLNSIDHMITNGVSIMGSRGHLGGAFDALLDLYRRGLFDPGALVTKRVDGLDELSRLLVESKSVVEKNCKVLVKFQTDGRFANVAN